MTQAPSHSAGESTFPLANFDFAPVIALPEKYDIYDFTQGYDPDRPRLLDYGIGRYDEARVGMYTTELFQGESEPRNIHLGIDIAAPVGEPVMAFADARVYLSGVNPAAGDYGGTVILESELSQTIGPAKKIWALFGHLSHASVAANPAGKLVSKGETFAWVGERLENGGWNPHLHLQLSWVRPETCDMPGAATATGREEALRKYPDPRLVLGPLY